MWAISRSRRSKQAAGQLAEKGYTQVYDLGADCRQKYKRTTVRVPTKDAGLGAKLRQNWSDLIGREDSDAVLQRRHALLSTACTQVYDLGGINSWPYETE